MKNMEGLTQLAIVEDSKPTAVQVMKMEVEQADFTHLYTNTLTENTRRAYMSTIKEFFGVEDLSDITVRDIRDVTPEMINMWATKQHEQGISPSTLNRKLSALNNFYKFLSRQSIGVAKYNPASTNEGCIRFKNAQKDYTDKRILEPHEINKMFNAAKQIKGIIGMRDLLVLELLATTGMRRAEICDIKIGDIQKTSGKHVINIIGKGEKHRFIVVTQGIYELIKEYLKARGVTMLDKELPLIVSHATNADPTAHVNEMTIYRIVKTYAEQAGIDPDTLSPHNLRHTFATTAYSKLGMKPEEIQKLLGHSDISTTMIYTHTADMIQNSPAEQLSELFG